MVNEFQQYNIIIKYRLGKEAVASDAISYRPDSLKAMLREIYGEEHLPYS